jgi:hypothetical protein
MNFNTVRTFFTPSRIVSWGLAFVVIWFGINEIISPRDWVAFAPAFLGSGGLALFSVFLHGTVLCACGLLLVFNHYRRLGAFILVLLLTEIIILLWIEGGLSDIVVRDIGLWSMALALSLKGQTPS